jgi:hypothetical protein
MTRLSAQATRLDVGSYPVALANRVMVKAIESRPVPLTEAERERLTGLMFAGAESGGPRW